jgi:flagellar biosynthesis/type III secretory pathway M-ring protein FliF/YscJ
MFLIYLVSALVAFAMWFAVIYAAIRLALKHDRAMQTRDTKEQTSAGKTSEAMRVYTETIEKRDLELERRARHAASERAETLRNSERSEPGQDERPEGVH